MRVVSPLVQYKSEAHNRRSPGLRPLTVAFFSIFQRYVIARDGKYFKVALLALTSPKTVSVDSQHDDCVAAYQCPGNRNPRLIAWDGKYFSVVFGTLYVPKHRDPKVDCLRDTVMSVCHRSTSAMSGPVQILVLGLS